MTDTILDTDILSEIFKERNVAVLSHALAYVRDHNRLTFTSVSVSEMLLGLYIKQATQQIKKATAFLKAHEELVPSSEDYWLAAEINAALRRSGKPIGDADPLIAACAINRDMVLATGNTRHYEFVSDVGFKIQIENWRDDHSL